MSEGTSPLKNPTFDDLLSLELACFETMFGVCSQMKSDVGQEDFHHVSDYQICYRSPSFSRIAHYQEAFDVWCRPGALKYTPHQSRSCRPGKKNNVLGGSECSCCHVYNHSVCSFRAFRNIFK